MSSTGVVLSWNGHPNLRLQMGVEAWYAFSGPRSISSTTRMNRRLLEYARIGNMHDGQGRNESVRVEFPDRVRSSHVSADKIQRAATRPLTGRCGG